MPEEPEYEEYCVTWEIEVGGATSYRNAAELALEAIQDRDTEAKAFTVKRYKNGKEKFIDLNKE